MLAQSQVLPFSGSSSITAPQSRQSVHLWSPGFVPCRSVCSEPQNGHRAERFLILSIGMITPIRSPHA